MGIFWIVAGKRINRGLSLIGRFLFVLVRMNRGLSPNGRFLFILVALCGFASVASAAKQSSLIAESQLAVPCKGPGCQFVATEKPWPKEIADTGGQVLKFGHFEFSIPTGARLRIVPIGAALVAEYGSGAKIAFHYEYAAQFQPDHIIKLYKRATLKITDFPRILFTKTPSDPEPALIYDRWIWRDAMAGKGLYFGKTEAAFVSKKGAITAYCAETPSSDHASLAYITDVSKPDSYMLIQFDGFGFDILEKLIGSIR